MVPFPQFELQSRLVARLLSGAASLPSVEQMQSEADAFYAGLRERGVPERWTHMMGDEQWCVTVHLMLAAAACCLLLAALLVD